MWNKFCLMAQSSYVDGKTDKSDLTCAQRDPVIQECLIINQEQYLVNYYRVVLSHLDELENPLGLV